MNFPNTAPTIERRHDLDALRAIAMLLGILLHAIMPFIGLPEEFFPLQDSSQAPWLGLILHAIHGFRMPLFFLISGFFTAMLWRKRGLTALLGHRFKRIFLPLLLGMGTIIPATWMAYSLPLQDDQTEAAIYQTAPQLSPATFKLYEAIGQHDTSTVQDVLKNGTSPNSRHPDGYTPLNACTYANNVAATKLLLEAGADPNLASLSDDRNTPLHEAAFWGQVEIADLLLQYGAKTSTPNIHGIPAAVLATVDIDLAIGIAKSIGLYLEKKKVEEGRLQILKMLNRINPLTQPINTLNAITNVTEFQSFPKRDVIAELMYAPVFHHLWFLWYLCWLIGAFAIWAFVTEALNLRLPRWLVMPPVSFLWLLPLTYLLQNQMGMEPESFGPDTAVGLIPVPAILGYYCIFFFYGAWYFDCHDREGKLGRFWLASLLFGLLLAFPLGLEFSAGYFNFRRDLAEPQDYRFYSVLFQVAYVWLMTFGSIGLFRQCFSKQSKRMRYVSDSSYWLYLAHVPLLMTLQYFLAELPIPAFLKLTGTVFICTAILLLSYEYCIRYTFVGTLLNGAKSRVPAAVAAVDLSAYKASQSEHENESAGSTEVTQRD